MYMYIYGTYIYIYLFQDLSICRGVAEGSQPQKLGSHFVDLPLLSLSSRAPSFGNAERGEGLVRKNFGLFLLMS